MYALYQKRPQDFACRYTFKEEVSLFGCNAGYIPCLLKTELKPTASEPIRWDLGVERALRDRNQAADALIINLKPTNSKPNLSLYEVVHVWGDTSGDRTPILLYLRGLLVDAAPSEFNDKDFSRTADQIHDPIFSMMYLKGTISAGAIHGPWTPPRPSSTNSVLLWPETFKYFAQKAGEIMQAKMA